MDPAAYLGFDNFMQTMGAINVKQEVGRSYYEGRGRHQDQAVL